MITFSYISFLEIFFLDLQENREKNEVQQIQIHDSVLQQDME